MTCKAFILAFLNLVLSSSTACLTIINQTSTEKVLRLQEAFRPEPQKNQTLAQPKPLFEEPLAITIPASSIAEITLREDCPVLLCTVVSQTKKLEETDEVTYTSKITTCYEPYDYGWFSAEKNLTNEWGLVFHEPYTYSKNHGLSGIYKTKRDADQGYGIKCLHPELLKKTTVKELPEEIR